MLIDTHAHLAYEGLAGRIDDVISKAKANGVDKIISIGCFLNEAVRSLDLASKYHEVYATVGLYPHDNGDDVERAMSMDERLDKVRELAKSPKIVAIGECGLDYSEPAPTELARTKGEQETLFRRQIGIARDLNLPVVIHSRRATEDTIRILESELENGKFRAVQHCFSDNLEVAQKLISMGFMISLTATITYPTGKDVAEAIKNVPLTSIMIETDSPFLVPHKERSAGVKLNEPCYVKMVAEKIAEIKGISLDEVAEITTKNAQEFFKLV